MQTGGWNVDYSGLTVPQQAEMKRREAEALTSIFRTARMTRTSSGITWGESEWDENVQAADLNGIQGTVEPPSVRRGTYFETESTNWEWSVTPTSVRSEYPELYDGSDAPTEAAAKAACEVSMRKADQSYGHISYGARIGPLRTVAHDGGDGATVRHCFSCGSGSVWGGSDGSVTCDFCFTTFSVQVQPAHPNMPQTIDGTTTNVPGMPQGDPTDLDNPTDPTTEQDENGAAEDPLGDADPTTPSPAPGTPRDQAQDPKGGGGGGDNPFAKKDDADKSGDSGEGDGDDLPPWLKKKKKSSTYFSHQGAVLPEDDYQAHLALAFADDREPVLEAVRVNHMARQVRPGG